MAKKEREPDAFALPAPPDMIHAVVPVAGTDQRQSMRAEPQTVQDRLHAMHIDGCRFVRSSWQVVVGILLRRDRAALEEVRRLVEHGCVAGGPDVPACGQWQPEVIVGAMRPHAPPGGWMPPMLDVAFEELPARAEGDLLARETRLGMDECHDVLQLIT